MWLGLIVAVALPTAFAMRADVRAQRDAHSASGSAEIALSVATNGHGEIYVMARDGSRKRRLTRRIPGSDSVGSRSPDWSPDGRLIVFSGTGSAMRESNSDIELYTMTSAGSERLRLTHNRVADLVPEWSPDGRHIAFSREGAAGNRARIVVMRRAGRNAKALTSGAFYDSEPSWSPDGRHIAFTRVSWGGDATESGLFVMNRDGSSIRRVVADGQGPAWSPAGDSLAFSSARDRFGETCFHECRPNGEIYTVDLSDGAERRLTVDEADDSEPSWSSSGTRLLFVSDRANRERHQYEIYAMRSDGSCATRLTSNSPDIWDLAPDWNPAAKRTRPFLRCR
jgi:Tol biopolymer transport system component